MTSYKDLVKKWGDLMCYLSTEKIKIDYRNYDSGGWRVGEWGDVAFRGFVKRREIKAESFDLNDM